MQNDGGEVSLLTLQLSRAHATAWRIDRELADIGVIEAQFGKLRVHVSWNKRMDAPASMWARAAFAASNWSRAACL